MFAEQFVQQEAAQQEAEHPEQQPQHGAPDFDPFLMPEPRVRTGMPREPQSMHGIGKRLRPDGRGFVANESVPPNVRVIFPGSTSSTAANTSTAAPAFTSAASASTSIPSTSHATNLHPDILQDLIARISEMSVVQQEHTQQLADYTAVISKQSETISAQAATIVSQDMRIRIQEADSTHLRQMIQDQNVRICKLEDKIAKLQSGGADDPDDDSDWSSDDDDGPDSGHGKGPSGAPSNDVDDPSLGGNDQGKEMPEGDQPPSGHRQGKEPMEEGEIINEEDLGFVDDDETVNAEANIPIDKSKWFRVTEETTSEPLNLTPLFQIDTSTPNSTLIKSWCYDSEIECVLIKRRVGVQYFAKRMGDINLPRCELNHLAQINIINRSKDSWAYSMENILRKEVHEGFSVFKPAIGVRRKITIRTSSGVKSEIKIKYPQANCLNLIPLKKMPIDFLIRFKRWWLNSTTGEACIINHSDDGIERDEDILYVYDPLWLINLTEPDLRILHDNRISYDVDDEAMALAYQRVVDVCVQEGVNARSELPRYQF